MKEWKTSWAVCRARCVSMKRWKSKLHTIIMCILVYCVRLVVVQALRIAYIKWVVAIMQTLKRTSKGKTSQQCATTPTNDWKQKMVKKRRKNLGNFESFQSFMHKHFEAGKAKIKLKRHTKRQRWKMWNETKEYVSLFVNLSHRPKRNKATNQRMQWLEYCTVQSTTHTHSKTYTITHNAFPVSST